MERGGNTPRQPGRMAVSSRALNQGAATQTTNTPKGNPMNKTELYALAKTYNIPGRSKMDAPTLEAALIAEGVDLRTVEENLTPAPAPYNEHSEARAAEDSDTHGGETDMVPFMLPRRNKQMFMDVPTVDLTGRDVTSAWAAPFNRQREGIVNGVTLVGRPKIKAARALLSQRYGMGGRGIGAKHTVSGIRSNKRRAALGIA